MIPAYEGKKEYLFASYAHKDSNEVLKVIGELYDRKYRVWYDEGIAPGSEWPKNIANHLDGCDAVVFFVSKSSIASPNCENEVSTALDKSKRIYQVSLDGTKHSKLEGKCEALVTCVDELISKLDDSFIGDGSGYERNTGIKKYGLFWNVLIAIAVIMVIALGTFLYYLDNGAFDKYLPGRLTENGNYQMATEATQQENIKIENEFLATAVTGSIGKEELSEKLTFENEDEMNRFCDAICYEEDRKKIRYLDLTTDDIEQVQINECNDRLLEYFTYLPKLKTLHIGESDLNSLEVLTECPSLEKVYIDYNSFPVDIPANVKFDVVLKNEQR